MNESSREYPSLVTVEFKYPEWWAGARDHLIPVGRPATFQVENIIVNRDANGAMTATFTGCEPAPNTEPTKDIGVQAWMNDPRTRDFELALKQLMDRSERLVEAIKSGSREGLHERDLDW